jgi:hypothetical protein
LQTEDFSLVFGLFSEVRILDNQVNQEVLSRYRIRNYLLVPREHLFYSISSFEFKVIHFGTYFRKYKNLNHLFISTGA